jgi:hypothetical protein
MDGLNERIESLEMENKGLKKELGRWDEEMGGEGEAQAV